MNCEACQDRLLEAHYDLLEPAEQAALTAHLAECAACQAAQKALHEQHGLLAEAARESFPEVRFEAPASPLPPQAPVVVSFAKRELERGFSWVRVAVAASILVVVIGGGIIAFRARAHHQLQIADAQDAIAATEARIAEQRVAVARQRDEIGAEIQRLETELNTLFDDWKQAADKTRREQQKQEVQVRVAAPRAMQAGAPFPVQLDIVSNYEDPFQQQRANAERFRGQLNVYDTRNNARVYQQNFDMPAGNNSIQLPQSIPLAPNQQLAMELLVENEAAMPVKIREQLDLTAKEYLTHVVTDRPMYRPGEVVRFRSLTVERFSLKPAQEDLHLVYRITGPNNQELFKVEGTNELKSAESGEILKGPDDQPLRGVGAGEYLLPGDLPGGTYTLAVSEAKNRFPQEKRTFLVNQWQMPRMNKEVIFSRSSYGPGDQVEVQAMASRVEGGAALALLPVNVKATVDGRVVTAQSLQTDDRGHVRFTFALPDPAQVPQGRGSVAVEFHDGAGPETIVRPIPIVLKKLNLEFFPEGGDLIAGVPNRVYFQARTLLDKPADIKGRIVDLNGAVIAEVATLSDAAEPAINQGQGAFTFTPQPGKRYQLKIDRPIGIEGDYHLPPAKAEGVVLHLPQPLADQALQTEVTSVGSTRDLLIGAYCRGKLLDQRTIKAPAGKTVPVVLRTEPGVSGVYRVTVFEIKKGRHGPELLPRAERLTFRKGDEKLDVNVRGIAKEYAPGDKVQLELESRNERNALAPAVALVSVVDLSTIKLADDKTIRTPPTHFLLTSEIRKPEDLENADALMGGHPQAETALDLLLGTQGWRRFAEQNPEQFRRQQPQAAQRLLQALATPENKRDTMREAVAEKVDQIYLPKAQQLLTQLQQKEAVAEGQPDDVALLLNLENSYENAQRELAAAQTRMLDFQRVLWQFILGLVVCGVLLAGVAAVVHGVRRMGRGQPPLAAFVTGTCLLAFLLLGSLLGTYHLVVNRGDLPWQVQAGGEGLVFADRDMARPMDAVAEQAEAPEVAPAVPEAMAFPLDQPDAPPFNAPRRAEIALLPPGGEGMMGGIGMAFEPAGAMPFGLVMPGQADMIVAEQPDERPAGRRNLRQLCRQRLGRELDLPPELPTLIVREYAHRSIPAPDDIRRDFTEMVFWHPALVLAEGKASVEFDLSDAVTRYRVLVLSHGPDGRLGADSYEIAARLPYSIDPKVPHEIASTDKVVLPVALKNDTEESGNAEIALRLHNLKSDEPLSRTVTLGVRDRSVSHFLLEPSVIQGSAQVVTSATFRMGRPGSDNVERNFRIVPDGFPVAGGASGLLEKAASHTIELPAAWTPGTLQCQVQVFPSVLGSLQKGLEALLAEPNGCFEQSSSSNYPNVLILNYLQEAKLAQPTLEARARRLLDSGYQKLTSFECLDPKQNIKRGYEWFGQTAPPHEALTAYGLLQFRDMAHVYPVEDAMLARTRDYLLGQRDGRGGFRRNPQAIDTFGRAPQHLTDAYIVWALTESGGKEDLKVELAALGKQAQASKDPYFVALVALSHVNRGQSDEGLTLLKKLREMQKADGRLEGAQTSITGSQGRDLHLETTALAVLGWLKANRPEEFFKHVHQGIEWIAKSRDPHGSFGATQSTILALKALIAYARVNQQRAEAGTLRVLLDGNPVADTAFSANVAEPIIVTVPDNLLVPGVNKVELEITGKNVFPYTLAWSCCTPQPGSAKDYPVELTARLSQVEAREGDTVKLHAKIINKTGKGQGMTVAVLGLPAGLAIPEDAKQLIEMAKLRDGGTKPGEIGAWELRGRELVLYWRDLAPDAKIDVELDLICRLPGTYRGPASRAYLYYHGDQRHWITPLAISIDPSRAE